MDEIKWPNVETDCSGNLMKLLAFPRLSLSNYKKRRSMPAIFAASAVLMLEAIGDTLLASAIFQGPSRALPSHRMLAFVSHANRGTADLLSGPDEVIVVLRLDRFPRSGHSAATGLTSSSISGNGPHFLSVTALSGARFTIGFKTPGQYRHYTFDAAPSNTRIAVMKSTISALCSRRLELPSGRSNIRGMTS